MASYNKVSAHFWRDPRIRGWLASGDERTAFLALYVKTCDHSNTEGLYWLPEPYVAADLKWKPQEVGKRLAALINAAYIEYDAEAEVIFVCDALELHSPTSAPQIKGALKALDRVPETPLLGSLHRSAETHAPTLAEAMRQHFGGSLTQTVTPTVLQRAA